MDFPSVKYDLIKTLSRLNDLYTILSPAPPNEGAYDTRKLVKKMITAITARLVDPGHFIFLSRDPKDIFQHFREIYNAPMIVVGENKLKEGMFLGDSDYERACSLQMAMAHIVENLSEGKAVGECPYYPNSCRAQKGDYCKSNPLLAPLNVQENQAIKACIMAYAARTLNASGKMPKNS